MTSMLANAMFTGRRSTHITLRILWQSIGIFLFVTGIATLLAFWFIQISANKQAGETNGRTFLVGDQSLESLQITVLGMIAPGRTAAVVAPFDGTVRERRVELGDRVVTGDVLFLMDPAELESRFREAQSGLLKASQALDALDHWETSPDVLRARRTLGSAESALAIVERQVSEIKLLLDRGIVSRNEFDGLVQQREAQRLSVFGAQQDLKAAIERGSINNRRLAELDFGNAKARVEEIKAQLDGSVVRAPAPGILIRAPTSQLGPPAVPSIEPGARLTRGGPAFAIADTTTFIVGGRVDEIDVNKIHVGQTAAIQSEAVPGQQFLGKVVAVSAEAMPVNSGGHSPMFEVRAAFAANQNENSKLMRIGMTARITIDIGSGSGAIIVPIDAVHDAATIPTVLIRRGNGEVVRQRVSLGRTNAAGVQVLTGLAIGDTVVLPE